MKTLTLVLVTILLPQVASAKLGYDETYAILSEDGSRIFVMLSNNPEDDEACKLPNGKEINLRETFSESGVYDFDTRKPIWEFEWHSNEFDIAYSEDFSSIIRFNDYGLISNTWGVSIINNGKTVRTYAADDLLTGPKSKKLFPLMTGGWYLRWYDEFKLSDNQLKLTTTSRGINVYGYKIPLGYYESYTFDIRTGNIIEKQVHYAGFILILIAPLLILGIIILFIYLKRKRALG